LVKIEKSVYLQNSQMFFKTFVPENFSSKIAITKSPQDVVFIVIKFVLIGRSDEIT